ncbi:hypothetical protein NOMA109596_08990 [Nocardioides marinus]|uniref:Uncharacterized protein n=1 Tax=Nocardioides marinus TaxID=374514 RepID=A0A7Y9YB53_9ACTN|nr:hypothetical protein [Nocardioides marinus]
MGGVWCVPLGEGMSTCCSGSDTPVAAAQRASGTPLTCGFVGSVIQMTSIWSVHLRA